MRNCIAAQAPKRERVALAAEVVLCEVACKQLELLTLPRPQVVKN
jgi:hypothetical protein